MCTFHHQYGTLDLAVRMTLDQRNSREHDTSFRRICSIVIQDQAFGFYDSRDFVRYREGRRDSRLREWQKNLDGHKSRGLAQGKAMRQHGASRLERYREV